MDTENENLNYGHEEDNQEAPESDIEIISAEDSPEPGQYQDSNEMASMAEEAQEEKPKKRKNDSQKLKVNQLMRDKYQLEHERNIIAEERNRLMQENESLRQINNFSTQAAVTNYETSTLDRLERAKDLKAQAYEAGDIKAQVDADIALTKALNEHERLQKWKEDQRLLEQQQQYQNQGQQYQQPQQQYQEPQPPQNPNFDIAQQWVQDNDWFMEQSPNYDADTRRFSEDLTNSMDAYLYRAGRQDAIYSPEYFEFLDNEIEKFRTGQYDDRRTQPRAQPRMQQQYQEPYQQQYQQPRNQYMTTPRSVTSGVSNSGARNNMAVNNRKQVKLSAEEIDFANRMAAVPGVTPEEYARHVMHDRQTAHLRQHRR